MSEDRWTYPAEGDTSGDIDREMTDPESVAAKQRERAVVNPQRPTSGLGVSSDAPGTNVGDLRRHEDADVGTEEETARRSPTDQD